MGSHGGRVDIGLQAADGQMVFVDALSSRLLVQHFGGCPPAVAAPLLELSSFKQDAFNTRKRFKALAHLPVGTNFQVAELDLSGVVSAEVLAASAEQLAKRADRRAKLAKDMHEHVLPAAQQKSVTWATTSV